MALNTELQRFYAGKRVLVTGHTGFKGGWLATWLKLMGSRVSGFALPPEPGLSLFASARVARGMTSTLGDIRDYSSLLRTFQRTRPEIVFHAAAQALVLRSYKDPLETYSTNVMGTAHVLEAARQTPSVKAVVVVTSDKCYENRELPRGYREDDPVGGFDPYSSSKGCAELVTSAYRRSFFQNGKGAAIATVRAGNVIGGGDWAQDRLVPDLIRGLMKKKTVLIRRPDAVRPWQHVLEPLRGYLMVGQKLWQSDDFADAWNFGPAGKAAPVEQVAQTIVKLWGSGHLRLQPQCGAPHETRYLSLNSGKARSLLHWKPALNLQQALALTVEWYREFARNPKTAERVTREQISRYMEMKW